MRDLPVLTPSVKAALVACWESLVVPPQPNHSMSVKIRCFFSTVLLPCATVRDHALCDIWWLINKLHCLLCGFPVGLPGASLSVGSPSLARQSLVTQRSAFIITFFVVLHPTSRASCAVLHATCLSSELLSSILTGTQAIWMWSCVLAALQLFDLR